MARLLAFLPLLLVSIAQAQSTTEAPTQSASPIAVIAFLVLFGGSIVAFVVYLWWQNRGKKPNE